MDNCLEKKIYDRQINKQGMADRVVDECNPDAHLSIKEVTNLCWDNEEDTDAKDFSFMKDKYIDVVMQKVLDQHSHLLSKVREHNIINFSLWNIESYTALQFICISNITSCPVLYRNFIVLLSMRYM